MDSKLFFIAVSKFLLGLLLVGLMLFMPAGSFLYRQAWLLIGILFIPMFVAGLILMKKNPDLLRKRLNAKEKQSEQKTVIALSGLMFAAAFIIAGLNYRYQWIVLPCWASWIASVLFLIAYALYAEVLRENTWLSRTIDYRSTERTESDRYWFIRYCAASDVYEHVAAFSDYAASVGFSDFLRHNATVHSHYYKTDTKRGQGLGRRLGWIHGI